MTPEEIVSDLEKKNSELLAASDFRASNEVLALMNAAAMNGFRLGSKFAISMVKGAIAVEVAKANR